MKNNVIKGTSCAIISALVFGITPVLAQITFQMGSNALTLTFYRNAMAVPVLLVFLLLRRESLKVTRKELFHLIIVSSLFSVTTTYLLYDSYNYIGIGLATTLHFLYPIFTVLFGFFLFRDRMGRDKIFALILATVGVVIATGGDGNFAVRGIVEALLSAMTYAGYLIGMEKTSIGKMSSMKAMLYMCIINSILVSVIDIPNKSIIYALDTKVLIYTLIISIANSAVAYVLLIVGIKMIGAGNAAIFSMFEPVSSVFAGMVFLSEDLPIRKLLSCTFILIAVSVPIIYDLRLRKRS